MRQIWNITKRELSAFFNSLIAYIVLILFLVVTGFFTWYLKDNNILETGQATLMPFFNIAIVILFVFIPALTMRLLAEENSSGTIELLLTKPINTRQVIIGKFLATLLLIVFGLALTIPYYVTVAYNGNIDHSSTIFAYLGLILLSATYISIGMFASSITNNQIVALIIAIVIGFTLFFIFPLIASSEIGILSDIMDYLSITTHFTSIARGVVDSRDIIYFLSIIIFSLFGAEVVIEQKTS